jgi:magnesium transporter
MGCFRGGRPAQVDGSIDTVFDVPQVREAREAISALHRRTCADGDAAFVRIGLFARTKAELVLISDVFEVPPHQVEIGQVAVFVGESFVLTTVGHGSTRGLRQVRDRLAVRPPLVDAPVGLLHAIADDVVDGYLAVTEQVADEVERLEELVFAPHQRDLSESIYLLKRENMQIRRAVNPMITVAGDLVHTNVGEVPPTMLAGFRDVGEHLLRVADQAEQVDTLRLGLMAASNAKATPQQSDDQRRIAAWAALALVPTVIFSLYGMSLALMPELEWALGYPAVLLGVAVVIALLYRRLRRGGWL